MLQHENKHCDIAYGKNQNLNNYENLKKKLIAKQHKLFCLTAFHAQALYQQVFATNVVQNPHQTVKILICHHFVFQNNKELIL